MITEDYVSFETAKLLKEKGFDWECFFCWDNVTETNRISSLMVCSNKELVEHYYAMPTLQMAMKWLREVHNIHPNIVVEVYGPYALYKIDRIFDGDEEKWVDFKDDDNISGLYNKMEEACEAAIRYCLENLI